MPKRQDTVLSYFIYLSALVIIIFGLKMASQIIIILFLSIFIASILSPILLKLQKLGLSRAVAFLVVYSLLFVALFFTVTLLIGSFESFIANLPNYEQKTQELLTQFSSSLSHLGFEFKPEYIANGLDIKTFIAMGGKMASNIGVFLSKMLLVMIGVAFLLFEAPHFNKKLEIIFKEDKRALENFALFSKTIQKYFSIKTLTSMLTGVFIALSLIYFDIPYPILWGFLGFLLNFIPVVGSLIASIPPLLLALFYKDTVTIFWLIGAYIIINNLISNILEPKIMGDGLGLSPAIVFFSLIFWGWVLGGVGMFLAVPLTMTIKIAMQSSQNTRWVGILMSKLSDKR